MIPKNGRSSKKSNKKELDDHKEDLKKIKENSDGHNVTLLYAAKDEEHNQAVVIKEYIGDMK